MRARYFCYIVLTCGTIMSMPQSSACAASKGLAETHSTISSEVNRSDTEVKPIDGHQLVNVEQLIQYSTNPSEMFAVLHRERRWAIDQTQFLHDRLIALAGKSREKPVDVPTISESEYSARLSELDAKIKQDENAQADSALEERQRVNAQIELVDLTRQKARLDLRLEESREYHQALADYAKAQQDEASARRDYEAAEHYLYTIDDTINGMLVTTERNNSFRLWIGAAFTILIALVIGGFFIIAWKERSIKDAFLSNDRGLQFLTLFSLIIAIIVFGVMNILEGRELSALLGGLSGYILGRSNLGVSADRKANDSNTSNSLPVT